VNHGEQLGASALHGFPHRSGVDGPAPRGIDAGETPADPLDNVRHPRSKYTVDADHDFVTGLNQVYEAGLHSGTARAGHRDREPVLGLEEVTQESLRLVHHGKKIGVQVADAWSGHGLKHSCRDVTRPRPHQNSFPRIEVPEIARIDHHCRALPGHAEKWV